MAVEGSILLKSSSFIHDDNKTGQLLSGKCCNQSDEKLKMYCSVHATVAYFMKSKR